MNERYGENVPNDGHADAFRHALWSALMTQEFGENFAERYGTAHETVPGNEADREAMDLYNNEVGRRIASENPDASLDELSQLIQDAIDNGEMVIIDSDGELDWSDNVEVGNTGTADDPPRDTDNQVPAPQCTES